ncbi:OmpA family protein [Mameliella alba]|uniref:OmpA family protein n=1 Tax=Mameliella alba TaxID=561184 RepID=UPI001ADCA67B|nr:OmpA family protein [Mameliella alba]
MHKTRKRLSILFAVAVGALSPAHAQTNTETLQLDTSRADSVTAIIKSLAPMAGQPATPPTGSPPVVTHPLPDVFLPPVILGRPTTIIIDRRPIVLNYGYSLDVKVYFAHDSAFLTPPARRDLDLIGQALRSAQLMNNRYLIAGHTDARGPEDYNVDLSYRRAWAVKRYLMRYHSIPSWRLEVVGWGERYPRNPADPYAAENRRVEITLIDTVQPVVPQPLPVPQPAPQTSDLDKQPAPQPMLPPQTGAQYVPPLPPCPAGVVSPDGKALDLDDFSPEPGIDCDPALPSSGRVIVRPDGRIIVLH